MPNLQGPHHDAQKSINTYFPLKDVIFTSVLLVLFNAIDGIVSPTSICAVAILVIKKNAKIILLILDYLIVSTVFPQVNIIEP